MGLDGTDAPAAAGESSIVKQGEPWFEDGNVMLVTYEQPTAFRLHRGVLARHSEIFQGMFGLPQPQSETEVMDGCQVVRMYDVPGELSNLLKALYDGVTFSDRTAEDFFFLAGILRLSTKYFIDRLRKKAIEHLSNTWSYTLSGHDHMVELALSSPFIDNITYPYVHPLHVLNLAREVNVRVIIPSVIYFLSLYPLADLLRADHPKLMIEHPSRPSSILAMSDIKDYTLMFQHRLDIILHFVRQVCGKRVPSQLCPNKELCTRGFGWLASRLARSWIPRTGPLHYMVQAMNELSRDPTVCVTCQEEFRQDVTLYRESLWQGLPLILGLPSWQDMKDVDLPTSSEP